MCGIAGFVDFVKGAPGRAVLDAMTHALRRRGPDANGILQDGACGLAHTRLSIIDVAGSPQPMWASGSDVSLVYNGELYNYLELRHQLEQAGEQLQWQGDTEVLLRWVSREWDRALRRFDGMFAFAAWDRRRQILLLARDPIGEKPLFYATPTPGVLVFGSEIKAVLEHPAVDGEIDLDGLRQVLRFRAVYGDRSLYRGVRQLPPGSFLEFTQSGLRIGQFYDLIEEADRAREGLRGTSEAQLLCTGEELLVEAIRERLIADVPVGAFLSGGLDSSLIVAIVKHLRDPSEQVRTFSVGFEHDRHSELPFAKAVADAIGTVHTEVRVGESAYVDRLVELSACRDAPISEPADVAVAEMSKVAKQSVKVVLSGEGADEVFGGYPKYRFADAPRLLRASLRAVGPERAAWMAGAMGVDSRRALVAARALCLPGDLDRFVQWFSYLDRADLHALLPGLAWSERNWLATTQSQQAALRRVKHRSRVNQMQSVDCLTWLPGNMLERGDRMTMCEGLELRPPFLDTRVAAFGLALEDRMKVRGGTSKWIVRQWASKLLPPQITRRKKWGFRVPLAQWFRQHLRPMLFDYLGSASGICGTYGDRSRVQKLLEAHDLGAVDASLSLWTLLTAEVWYQQVYQSRRETTMSSSIAGAAT